MFRTWLEQRKLGKSLPETGYAMGKVVIYRATIGKTTQFKPKDYVTLSPKFARGHADHNAGVGDDSVVLRAMVNAGDVYEAYNPGEYFYNGPIVEGMPVYTSKAIV